MQSDEILLPAPVFCLASSQLRGLEARDLRAGRGNPECLNATELESGDCDKLA